MKNRLKFIGISIASIIGVMQTAQAHTSFVVKEADAGSNFYATLNVGHGCGDENDATAPKVDTYKLVLDIPESISGLSNVNIRPMEETWGKATIVKNDEGKITQLIWTKPAFRTGEEAEIDTWGYRASFLVRLPNEPFTKVVFPAATQYCMKADGETELSVAWEGSTAPTLTLLPKRQAGWNKFSAPVDMDESAIKSFFASAQIVWVGDQAYSANTITASAIAKPLTSISKDAEIWVKY